MKLKRALISVYDKTGLLPLAQAFKDASVEIIATGNTLKLLESEGIAATPIEKITKNPEILGGRVKTLSYQVFSGILFRREFASDLADIEKVGALPIDCVCVNFYPFADHKTIEMIDIGGPTMVRAAAKNAPHVLVLSNPSQYGKVIAELKSGEVSDATATECALAAWQTIAEYDDAIASHFSSDAPLALKYGENPHQTARLKVNSNSPILWNEKITTEAISYNNILDVSAGFELLSALTSSFSSYVACVILKHNNPCGVAVVPKTEKEALKKAFELAWQGDPISSFGGIVLFNEKIDTTLAETVSQNFIELVAMPNLTAGDSVLTPMQVKRKKLKALSFQSMKNVTKEKSVTVVGGTLTQSVDSYLNEELKVMSGQAFSESEALLSQFAMLIAGSLKSNAVSICIERNEVGAFQLIGAGQGQPNRVDAISSLAVPRAKKVCEVNGLDFSKALLASDAFFPFADGIESIAASGLKKVVQPGGSVKDAEVCEAAQKLGISMSFTGRRHFKH